MEYQTNKNSITFSEEAVQRIGGMVVLPLKEYEELRKRALPVEQLRGKQAEELDNLVAEGLREYRAGKTKVIKSLSDLD